MKLYYSPGACSLSPHIVLCEAGLPHALVKVDLKTKKMADGGDYLQVNGKGYVPVLELDDGQRLSEGPAIVQYLADQKPDSALAPNSGSMERYRLQEWLNFISTEVHKQFSPLFNPGASEDWKQAARANLSRRFDWIATRLQGRPYLMGERFTVADAYLFTVLNWCALTGIDLGRWPALKDYAARVGARPKVQEALKAEGLVK
ncbi:MAG TPA: glutathione transferase GstA [Burkholderiales bacterium]|nr:glutathione transferase GstA [Burkholderiales bacterium]